MASDQRKLTLLDIKNNLISEFDKEYLPSQLQVLQRLLYETRVKNSKLADAVKIVIKEIIPIWQQSPINIKRTEYCEVKLHKLYKSYEEIRKFQNKETPKVSDFLKKITDVFDISKDDVIQMLGSMDDATKQSFLSKPVDYIKSKKSITESGHDSDEDVTDTPENTESLHQCSTANINIPEMKHDEFNETPPRNLIEPEKKPNIRNESLPPTQLDLEKEINEKFSQSISIGEAENEDARILSQDANIVPTMEIITRAKAQLLLESSPFSSEETPGSSQSSHSIFHAAGRNYKNQNKRGTINVMTPHVVAAFDKANVSDRDAVFLVGLVANTLQIGLESLIINRKSINLARAQIRKQEFERMKQLIQDTPVTFLIVHWDGKLIADNVACKKVDRLLVLVSNDEFTKIINVPALQDQKANIVASEVYASLKDWGLLNLIKALCCDTTNVNLGSKSGAAMLLEQMMGTDLLYLAYRRHVLEVVLRAAYEQKFPGTSGPDVPHFKRFREEWSTFDMISFENGLVGLEKSLQDKVTQVIENIKKFLKEQQPRNDYRELLQICLIFLGSKDKITFKKPGAVHHARWMSKAIYSIKMYLFRKSFSVSKTDEKKLHAVCKFIVFVYLTPWFTAPLAISAPNNDLQLIRSLIDFQNIDKNISDATLRKFRNHLWYLSPELTVLPLLDDNVQIATRRSIVQSFKNEPLDDEDDEEDTVKKFDPSDEGIRALYDKTLDHFTNSRSLKFVSRFDLDKSFLDLDCGLWKNNISYLEYREKMKHLTVVNDCAERAVHLAEEYLHTRFRDEEQKQYLLQFIEESRRNVLASADKNQLIKKLKTK